MWPSWSQDLLPPSVWVEITPGDSMIPNRFAVRVDGDPASLCQVKIKVSASGKHLDPQMKTDPIPASSPPGTMDVTLHRRMPFSAGATMAAETEYDSTSVAGSLDKIKLQSLAGWGGVGALAPLKGLFVNRDTRLNIRVLARDNQYLAPYPVGGSAPEDPLKFFDPASPVAAFPNYGPPYMPARAQQEVLAGRPGVTWWLEDDQYGLLSNSINMPDVVFRFGNFQGDPKGAKPSFLRITARDPWGNRTDLAIPIYIWSTVVSIERLESTVGRK
jgi:hypothetical protein